MTADPCTDPPPPELRLAVEQFNRGEFFECHETLEQLWTQEVGPIRSFHQGIIQVATGLHHWRRGNLRGARICLDGGLNRLRQAPPLCQQIDVTRLVRESERLRAMIAVSGDRPPADAHTARFLKIWWTTNDRSPDADADRRI